MMGVFRYTYDGEGNRVAKVSKNSRTEYFWDHRNRLVKVIDNGKMVGYDYDCQNRLVRRNDEIFVHDGWQIACSLKNGRIAHRYLWGAEQDELLAMDDNWALRDHLNTVRKVIDAKGKIISTLEYNAFGKLISSTGEKPLFRYTGKMFDDATGLQWNINRWYDAKIGRWMSEDPIGNGKSDLNLYRYVKNLPLAFTDVSGLKTDQQKCDEYANRNNGKPDTFGFILCYNGKMIGCVNNQAIDNDYPSLSSEALSMLKGCVAEHEKVHLKQGGYCPPCGIREAVFCKTKENEDECAGYGVEATCLENALERCYEDTHQDECLAAVLNRMQFVRDEEKRYCDNA